MAEAARSATQDQGGEQVVQQTAKPSLSLLAREAFGNDFHGEVTETKPSSEPEIKEGAEEQENQYEEPTTEGEAAPDQEAAEAEGEEVPVATIRELVEHLEADPEWFNDLKVDVVVHDKASQVPLKDLVANYQANQAAEERLAKVKERSEQAQQEHAQRLAAVDAQFAVAANLVENLESQLTAEMAAINWDQLHREDPALWSAEKVRFGEKQQQLQQTKQNIAMQYQHAMTARQEEMKQQFAAHLQKEHQLLLQTMPKLDPDWGDQTKIAAKQTELANYLLSQGFSREEVMGASDHRLLLVAKKAELWDRSQGQVQLTKKRIQTVPKVIKPGATKAAPTVNQEKVKAAHKQLAQSGKLDDALAVLRAKKARR